MKAEEYFHSTPLGYLYRTNKKRGFYYKVDVDSVIRLMEDYAREKVKSKDEKIKKLEFMIDNGLDWKDMENDITYPHEI